MSEVYRKKIYDALYRLSGECRKLKDRQRDLAFSAKSEHEAFFHTVLTHCMKKIRANADTLIRKKEYSSQELHSKMIQLQ